ncbi:hypothetical protein COW36_13715 [bacterium (Candidatus Blackallbacteria) CG17_big_fil_post_rev_8_21_14_2_50_48_46]|uniref:ABC transporter domain-containing protein n=1 Tax=bacterium (Candidatus Blackallbacteria) CG17_big_fil_post_rev_8_21_14_2_50_48_46 TaxID=2014261 RepID=A0A2M7G2X2_9BACT|nr:MAG: hypothetical protein COW64_07260 [bacterium (Candidatus Blackallbacteria) CG18_big_fil_WC_8_21_14_2_50_49_26]PIW16186.1 MAG: hypothetical protein COW36_13715 [bacterium (Candidatus Blackallbacteria) CG17_big_fil_post_rev_8_21_14_2_50_48_46]PIW49932.1 MAG: hypothetical protein COW20_04590 [bacterium (Candidatus Blackallbacteria) CG13_big_fil_rev_8_21_14_2_50_49_14]
MTASILTLSELSFTWPGSTDWLFQGLHLEVFAGSRMGIVGVNGAGKSTLFQLLRGELEADLGEITVSGVSYLVPQTSPLESDTPLLVYLLADQEACLWLAICQAEAAGFPEPLAYAENLADFVALDGYTKLAQAQVMAEVFGFQPEDYERPFHSFSGGEKRLLVLAKAFVSGADLLLLDEPTHDLDQVGLNYLLNALALSRAAVCVISHDRWFLDQAVNQIFYLERGAGKLYAGNYSCFSATRQAEFLERLREKQRIERELEHLKSLRRNYRDWGAERERGKHAAVDSGFEGARAARLQKRAVQARERMDTRIERLQEVKPWVDKTYRMHFPEPRKLQGVCLDVRELILAHSDFAPLSFQILGGQKWALQAPNGAGKSTLLKTLSGELKPLSGQIYRARGLRLGYLPQQFSAEQLSLAPREIFKQEQAAEARRLLGAWGISGDYYAQALGLLSEGQQRKLWLIHLLLQAPDLLLLDEPSNHLDYEAIEALEMLISQYAGSVLLTSHDQRLLEKFADSVWHLPFQGKNRPSRRI